MKNLSPTPVKKSILLNIVIVLTCALALINLNNIYATIAEIVFLLVGIVLIAKRSISFTKTPEYKRNEYSWLKSFDNKKGRPLCWLFGVLFIYFGMVNFSEKYVIEINGSFGPFPEEFSHIMSVVIIIFGLLFIILGLTKTSKNFAIYLDSNWRVVSKIFKYILILCALLLLVGLFSPILWP